ncbi:MAG: FHA domain-containing protein [Bacteroidales bacterium]|nr:FHA domain-containing protein [Bacteroidales bacterium]
MEILIGRENTNLRRLQISVGDVVKFYGETGSVPKSVSRRHCKLIVSGEKYMIESLTDGNSVYVNGKEVVSKYLQKSDRVLLGEDKYELDWTNIIDLCVNALNGYSLADLKLVWEKYDKEKLDMQISSSRFNAISSIPMILSLGSGVLSALPSPAGSAPVFRVIAGVIAGILLVLFCIIRFSNSSKQPMKQRELDQWFHKNYVCPNPKCGRFLGYQPFDDLAKNSGCLYCKAKYRAD